MLILTRKKNETIVIGDNVEITVLESDDGKVKLGINAPKSVKIHRKEVFDQIIEENKVAKETKLQMQQLKVFMSSKKED